MNSYVWEKINSNECKHQLYHLNFEIFSWVEKNYYIPDINSTLNKNILKPYKQHDDLIYSIIDKDNKKKSTRSHRLIFYAFYQNKITGCSNLDCKDKGNSIFNLFGEKHHIDHIDGNHSNNNPLNLQRLCSSCHNKKTYLQTKNTRTNAGIKQSINIVVYKKDDKEYKKEFINAGQAGEELQLDSSRISKSVRDSKNNIITWVGSSKHKNKYRFEEIFNDEIEYEIWKDVPGTDGQVSNKGRVKNKSGISYGNLYNGYYQIGLNNKKYKVHILTMKTFKYKELLDKVNEIKNNFEECKDMGIDEIINSKGKRYSIMVDHIDRNSNNNILENLRWVSVKENSENTNKVKEVEQWSIDKKELINTFKTQSEASKYTNISIGNISSVCNGNRKSAGGYFWKFK